MAETHPLPQPAPDVMFQQFDDGAVLFSTRGEVYFALNAVGASVWGLLPTAASFETLCGEIETRHPGASPETVRRDVHALLADLAREGLVAPAAGADGGSPTA